MGYTANITIIVIFPYRDQMKLIKSKANGDGPSVSEIPIDVVFEK